MKNSVGRWLEQQVKIFNTPDFISEDPISVPHRFTRLQDIEIAGLFAAIMSWGQRLTIRRKANELMDLMESSPYQFILEHKEKDRKVFLHFKHRTFQPDDVIFLVSVLQKFYASHHSLEDAFAGFMSAEDEDVFQGLKGFHEMIFSQEFVMERTRKHISTPVRKSGCKRLNMFLRWMVRSDDQGVDFGLWKKISPAQLVMPLDLHVGRVARQMGLLDRQVNDWQAAIELTNRLKQFDPADPVKYDFALFGAGIYGNH